MDDKEIFKEIEKHILHDSKPSIFLSELKNNGVLENSIFKVIGDLEKTPQDLNYHPEGSVWNHTLLVVDEASMRKNNSSNKRVFLWAALLHDIGKRDTTKMRNGRLTAYDHDTVGSSLANYILSQVCNDATFVEEVSNLVRFHMHTFYITNNLPFSDKDAMIKNVNISELAVLSLCDRLGRGDLSEKKIKEEKLMIDKFLDILTIDLGRKITMDI